MDTLFSQYDEIQSWIECSVDDKDTMNQFTERHEFENQYYAILAQAQQLINNHKIHNDDDSSSDSCVAGNQSSMVKHTKKGIHGRGIKLPTIQVPKFGGQYEDWLEFRDTFVSMIHTNESINNIQRFHYLRACLEGGAAQVIRSLEFSSNNYNIAWDLLCDRYNNSRLLIQNHVRSLFSLEPLKRESSQSIRKLIDLVSKNLRSLQVLGEPTTSWDTLIIYLVNSKLDPKTSREWEERKSLIEQITLNEFMSFLKQRADLLDTIHMNNKSDRYAHNSERTKSLNTLTTSNWTPTCPVCKKDHRIFNCNTFLSKSTKDRADCVRNLRLCLNCLRPGHRVNTCKLGTCTKCSHKHNTLLHDDTYTQGSNRHPPVDTATVCSVQTMEQVLLSTAVVYIKDKDNQSLEVRAVLDSGSQASFITESLKQKLKLTCISTQLSVVGINNSVSQITKRCNTSIESRVSTYRTEVSFLVLPNITNLCKRSIHIQRLELPKNIELADPKYYSPSSIDMLLGADIFWDLLEQNQIRLGANKPVLQKTKLGYIVSGPTSGLIHSSAYKPDTFTCNYIQNTQTDIQESLAKFWAIEEPPNNSTFTYSVEENNCEEHFIKNYTRTSDGRFSVAIPLKMPESCLGDSYERAKHCFLSLERRLQRQPKLQQMYKEFMIEYKELGQMSLISNSQSIHSHTVDKQSLTQHIYYLPHHGVLRENSTTTKLRVVFNASAPTSTGVSCNDLQMIGPTIQSDLISILLRFRHYTYVLTGDIEKMYRQVLIHKNQRHLQQIIWRDDITQELQTYQLNTVTYGTASAPFLAIRCLHQLAIECNDNLVSQIISQDFYVDDLVTGSQCKSQLSKLHTDICHVLSKGQFNLRKIKSNIQELVEADSDTYTPLNLGHETTTTLGLGWSSLSDELCFSQQLSISSVHTKRSILSTVGQIFDPLGLLSVFIIQAKIILQKLWLHKISWDDPLPSHILQMWLKFLSGLKHLHSLRIPRCVTCDDPSVIEIHTFCDSSQDAYGACVYIRSSSDSHNQLVRLLCAKSKVAPLKTLTIPRLELCGALVAARLTHKVIQAFRLHIHRCMFWTDSSIVLGWLKTTPNKLKQFVRNRVIEIQELTQNHGWRHVPTNLNPADLITRGVNMSEIETLSLWWFGPPFLSESEDSWPNKQFHQSDNNAYDLPEVITHIATSKSNPSELIDMYRFSILYSTLAKET